jgi:hypothetical protein
MTPTDEDLKQRAIEALASSDAKTRNARAERLVWLSRFQIPDATMSRLEPLFLMEQARVCYINGQYIAVLLTALAFIEQTLVEKLEGKKETGRRGTFEMAIASARSAKLFEAEILNRTDDLRKIRNPFAHKKPANHAESLGSRFRDREMHPTSVLEEDAKHAVKLMYEFFTLTLKVSDPYA